MKQDVFAFFIPIALFSFLAYLLQVPLVFSPDVGYLLYASKQLLAGGNYVSEIFETNPPMILYLYSPIWWLANWMHIEIIFAARLYALLLASLSAVSCFMLLKKITAPKARIYFYSLFYTVLLMLFILPLKAFLQREHILLMVLLPYLFAAVLALEDEPLPPVLAFFIGLFAAAGFALKPFFLVTFCLIEGCFILKKRHFFAWVRMESLIIVSVLLIYFATLWLYKIDYFHVIIPLVLQYYYPIVEKPWIDIISVPSVSFCLAILISYPLLAKHDKFRTMGTVLFLGLLGMTVALLLSRTPWYYHVLPAFGLAFLLVMHYFGQAVEDGKRIFLPIVVMVVILIYPIFHCYQVYQSILLFTQNDPGRKLTAYLNSFSGEHSVHCFSTYSAATCFPLVYQTNSVYAQRFPAFWWYTGLRLAEKNHINPVQVRKDKAFLVDKIAEDLNRHQARWVIIDENSFNWMEDKDFSLINMFSENNRFRVAWQQYGYKTNIDHYSVYERIR